MARDRLKQRRIDRGLTPPELAAKLHVDVRTTERYESGELTPPVWRRRQYADLLNWTVAELNGALADDGSHTAGLNGHEVPAWLGHLASLEQGAASLWAFELAVVHGLLQTPRYAALVESRGPTPVTEAQVTRKVEIRLERQAVLYRRPDPLDLAVVLDESVLRRVPGDPDTHPIDERHQVLAEQLEHLVQIAARPNIDLRILPLDAGVFSATFGAFTVFTSPGSSQPYMACVEDRSGPHYLDRPPEVEAHTRLFRYLTDVALSPDASADMIRTAAKEHLR